MGKRIDRFRPEEWTARERIRWPAEVTLPNGLCCVREGTMVFAIPPARFRPLPGDIYLGPDKKVHMHREGAEVPPGSKFPLAKTWSMEAPADGANPL